MIRQRRRWVLVKSLMVVLVLGVAWLLLIDGSMDGSSGHSASPASPAPTTPATTTPTTAAPTTPAPVVHPASARLPVSTGPTHWHGHRVLYLTFDDGPSVYTPRVLAVLRRYGDTATFFEIGRNAAALPAYVADVVAEGSAVGNHTYTHPDLDQLSARQIHGQLVRTDRAIRAGGAPTTRCVRPPYGANDLAVREEIRRTGKSTIVWDIDTLDWKRPGTLTIARAVIHHARPGDIAIMHDGGGDRSQTVAALKLIAAHFARLGWVIRALPICAAE